MSTTMKVTESTPATAQSTTKVFDPVKAKSEIDSAFAQSEQALISAARAISGTALGLVIHQGIDQTKTMITNSNHQYAPIANGVLEIAKVPLTTSAQTSAPNSSEASVKISHQTFKGAAHGSVDVVDRSFTSLNL